jgi:hypothetical protein
MSALGGKAGMQLAPITDFIGGRKKCSIGFGGRANVGCRHLVSISLHHHLTIEDMKHIVFRAVDDFK